MAEFSAYGAFRSAVLVIAVLEAERVIRARVRGVEFFVEDFLLADVLELLLPEVFFRAPVPRARETLDVHCSGFDGEEREDVSVFLKVSAIAIASHSAHAMPAERTDGICTFSRLQNLAKLDSLLATAEIFRAL